jgi:hypothetical protein
MCCMDLCRGMRIQGCPMSWFWWRMMWKQQCRTAQEKRTMRECSNVRLLLCTRCPLGYSTSSRRTASAHEHPCTAPHPRSLPFPSFDGAQVAFFLRCCPSFVSIHRQTSSTGPGKQKGVHIAILKAPFTTTRMSYRPSAVL